MKYLLVEFIICLPLIEIESDDDDDDDETRSVVNVLSQTEIVQ